MHLEMIRQTMASADRDLWRRSGRSPQRGPRAEPLVTVSGVKPPGSRTALAFRHPMEAANCLIFCILKTQKATTICNVYHVNTDDLYGKWHPHRTSFKSDTATAVPSVPVAPSMTETAYPQLVLVQDWLLIGVDVTPDNNNWVEPNVTVFYLLTLPWYLRTEKVIYACRSARQRSTRHSEKVVTSEAVTSWPFVFRCPVTRWVRTFSGHVVYCFKLLFILEIVTFPEDQTQYQ